jgi:hypothetical protein
LLGRVMEQHCVGSEQLDLSWVFQTGIDIYPG